MCVDICLTCEWTCVLDLLPHLTHLATTRCPQACCHCSNSGVGKFWMTTTCMCKNCRHAFRQRDRRQSFVACLLWPVFCGQSFVTSCPLSMSSCLVCGPFRYQVLEQKKNPHKKFLPQNLWLWSTPAMCRRNLREVVGILNLSRTKRLAALWCFGEVSMRCDCNAPIRSMCFFLLTPR